MSTLINDRDFYWQNQALYTSALINNDLSRCDYFPAIIYNYIIKFIFGPSKQKISSLWEW